MPHSDNYEPGLKFSRLCRRLSSNHEIPCISETTIHTHTHTSLLILSSYLIEPTDGPKTQTRESKLLRVRTKTFVSDIIIIIVSITTNNTKTVDNIIMSVLP